MNPRDGMPVIGFVATVRISSPFTLRLLWNSPVRVFSWFTRWFQVRSICSWIRSSTA
jgi:hypothetical protein